MRVRVRVLVCANFWLKLNLNFRSIVLLSITSMIVAMLLLCATPSQIPPNPNDPIKDVFIVFSNHLDIGYTLNNNGSCAGAVINESVAFICRAFPASTL